MYCFTAKQVAIFAVAVLVCSTWFFPACMTQRTIHAADDFQWTSDLDQACFRAREKEKTVLVIDFAGDFTAHPFTSRMGRLLDATTFSDPRIIELSRQRFEVVCRQHGQSEWVKRQTPKREPAMADHDQADNVVFYFCTPDARVLHLAVGFLPADKLLEAAGLAERLLRASQLERTTAGQMGAVRSWHLACANGKHLLDFQRRCAGKRDSNDSTREWSPSYVRQVLMTAGQIHRQELTLRFASHWRGAALEEAIERLAHHGEVSTSFAHLVLSELPLVRLDTLDRICFEAVTGQRFLATTPRRKALYGWFVTKCRQRQPIMIVVEDRPFAAQPVNELAELLVWQPSSPQVVARLTQFAAVQLTPGELATLVKDAALAPVTLSRNSRNWLLFNRQGNYVDVVGKEQGPRLQEAMDLASQ